MKNCAIIFILIILLIAGMFISPQNAGNAAGGNTFYADKMHRRIDLSPESKRAVMLSTYELIPVLDIWKSVAGIGRWAYTNDLMIATNPGIRSITSVGSGTDVNMEALCRLRPDAVITWTFKPEQIAFMEKMNLRVIAVYPDSLSELYDVIRMHGRLFGRGKRAESAIAAMERMFSIIRSKTSGIPVSGKKKILWIGSRPTSVTCADGIMNDVISLIGGVNPASVIRMRNTDVSIEKIIQWNPDVIFIWGSANYGVSDILNRPQFRYIGAVRNRRVYKTPDWSTWSPRIAPVTLWMAMKTYPELYRDISFDTITDRFYRTVFGIPYSKVKKIED